MDDGHFVLSETLHQGVQLSEKTFHFRNGAAACVNGNDRFEPFAAHARQIEVVPDMPPGGGQIAPFTAVAGGDKLLEDFTPGQLGIEDLLNKPCCIAGESAVNFFITISS